MIAIEKMIEALEKTAPYYRPNAKQMRAAVAALADNVTDEMVKAGEIAFDGGWSGERELSPEWRKNFRNALSAALLSISSDTN